MKMYCVLLLLFIFLLTIIINYLLLLLLLLFIVVIIITIIVIFIIIITIIIMYVAFILPSIYHLSQNHHARQANRGTSQLHGCPHLPQAAQLAVSA